MRTGKESPPGLRLPKERPFRIYLNESLLVNVMATPSALRELIVGWLLSNDLIESFADIKNLLIDKPRSLIWVETDRPAPEGRIRTISSGCGGGVVVADMGASLGKLPLDVRFAKCRITESMQEFLRSAPLYKETGGVHGAALADNDGVVYIAEDIGRHNAVDKVIGRILIDQLTTPDKMILTTGRISAEMIIKTAKAKIPLAASLTAATDLAVSLAEEAGITVIGYVRARKMTAYAWAQRIF